MNKIKLLTRYLSAGAISCSSLKVLIDQNECGKIYAKENAKSHQLIGVILVGRHGARTPFKQNLIPGIEEVEYKAEWLDPLVKAKFNLKSLNNGPLTEREIASFEYLQKHDKKRILKGGAYQGQLTFVGEQQLFDLGRKLKKKYVDEMNFLSKHYDPNEISVRSTNVKRCINSAKSLLAGLYLSSKSEENNVPFEIKVGPLDDEYLFPNNHNCPTLKNFSVNIKSIILEKTEHWRLLDLLENKLGYKPSFISFIDDIHARMAHDLPIPSDTLNQLIEKGSNYAAIESHIDMKNNLKLNVGLILNLIKENLTSIINKGSPKFYYYSAHDVTLNALLATFDLMEKKHLEWPPFGAYLIIEIYQAGLNSSEKINDSRDLSNFLIKFHYCDNNYKIPDCNTNEDGSISLAEFLKVISKHSIDHSKYTELCQK